jgi:hypothetical protein
MRALEFKTRIENNKILIPAKIQSELTSKNDREVRIIVLVDDNEVRDDIVFQDATQSQFLNGYADSDSIYDNY